VVAHGLLGALATASRAIDILGAKDGNVPVEEFQSLTRIVKMQLGHVSGTLEDLVRGLSPDARHALDDLALPRGAP
jgi:hypothetical protein